MESSELKNVTISVRANEICETFVGFGYFETAIAVYRAAVAVALANGLEPVHTDESLRGTLNKWDSAAVFRDTESNVEPLMLLCGVKPDRIVTDGKILAELGLRLLEEKRLANVDLLEFLTHSTVIG